jgi:hypothetical protein
MESDSFLIDLLKDGNMEVSKRVVAMVAAVIVCTAGLARAGLVTIEITGEVTGLDDRDGLLGGDVTLGQEISGWYWYESSTPDSNPLVRVGDYYHYSAPYGMELHIGDLVFQTDPQNVRFLIEVVDSHLTPPLDGYLAISYDNLPLQEGLYIPLMAWELHDTSATALSNALLPTTAPDVSDWSAMNWLRIELGLNPDQGSAMISGRVTSADVVPEPVTILLLAVGTIAVIRKNRTS